MFPEHVKKHMNNCLFSLSDCPIAVLEELPPCAQPNQNELSLNTSFLQFYSNNNLPLNICMQ
jgi:hypothetical protein